MGRTAVVIASVDGAEGFSFPPVKSQAAMWTPVTDFRFAKSFVDLREGVTDFTAKLFSAFAIVEIEKL